MTTLNKDNITYIPWDTVRAFMIDVFKAYGVPEDDAQGTRRTCWRRNTERIQSTE